MRAITFYSYKGGTGRTLLVANVAVMAASLGKKVVAIDFDLEAPGLPYKLLGSDPPRNDGLVGWLRDWFSVGGPPAALDEYLIDVEGIEEQVPGGSLKLMPAGRAPSPNYFQDLHTLHLAQRLDDGSGLDALVDLQRQMDEELTPDVVLLDARTGITSTNTVTTHILADEVVALSLGTKEQLEGTRAVLRALQPAESLRTSDPVRLHFVLSRVAAKPAGENAFETTATEKAELDRVTRYLTEPASVPRHTLGLDPKRVYMVHNEPALAQGELVTFRDHGKYTSSPYHVDQWRIGVALLPEAEPIVVQLFSSAAGDVERLRRLSAMFPSPEGQLETAGALARAEVQGEPSLLGGQSLEDRLAFLRAQVRRDPNGKPAVAGLLVRTSSHLAELGRREEALGPSEEAVGIYRDLAAADPAAYRPGQAT